MTMQEMRTDLAAWLTTLLQAHDTDFVIDTTERKELELNSDRKSRIGVMGDPSKYCYIKDMGQATTGEGAFDAAGNVDCFIGQRFRVQLFYEKDYDTSQESFESIVYDDRAATIPGILDSIRADRSRIVSGEEYTVGREREDAFLSIQRGTWDFGAMGGQPELYHYLEFEVYLIS